MTPRRQLTLFVPSPQSAILDALRETLDPIQAGLIPAHVTLCREDEFADAEEDALFHRVRTWRDRSLGLTFGPPRRFLGHGVLLPCDGGADVFGELRRWILPARLLRDPEAHLTLAHPRNPRAPGNTDLAVSACPRALRVEFPSVALIEQHGSGPWVTLRSEPLGPA